MHFGILFHEAVLKPATAAGKPGAHAVWYPATAAGQQPPCAVHSVWYHAIASDCSLRTCGLPLQPGSSHVATPVCMQRDDRIIRPSAGSLVI
jgi:hypothetical protein